jgi:hypothetical protein
VETNPVVLCRAQGSYALGPRTPRRYRRNYSGHPQYYWNNNNNNNNNNYDTVLVWHTRQPRDSHILHLWTSPRRCQNVKAVVLPHLTFVGPCIVIYFYSTTNQMHNISNLFWNNTLHVSDGLSVHHQESKTVHTASGIYHTCSVAACLRYCASGWFYYRNTHISFHFSRYLKIFNYSVQASQ